MSTDALREVTVNGVRYFHADDVERWHRDYIAAVERADEMENALNGISALSNVGSPVWEIANAALAIEVPT